MTGELNIVDIFLLVVLGGLAIYLIVTGRHK